MMHNKPSAYEIISMLEYDISMGILKEYRIEYNKEYGTHILVRGSYGWFSEPWWTERG